MACCLFKSSTGGTQISPRAGTARKSLAAAQWLWAALAVAACSSSFTSASSNGGAGGQSAGGGALGGASGLAGSLGTSAGDGGTADGDMADAGMAQAGAADGGSAQGGSRSAQGGAAQGGKGGGNGAHAGAGSGGHAGNAGNAGAGGRAPVGCDACGGGSYCQDGANKCRSCADFSRLEFAAPEKLATLSQTESGNERFPRSASASSDLFYRSGASGAERLWYAATPVTGIGVALSSGGHVESGPLLAPGVLPQNFFFDRLDTSTNLRHLMVANWPAAPGAASDLASAIESALPAPAPFNAASDFSIAVAPAVGRAYWMSTRGGKATADLLWVGMVGGATTDPAVLDLQVQAGSNHCARLGADATPWVNAAGTLLLFRNESVDDSCNPNDSHAFDLYAAPLAKETGLASAPAVPLSSLNNTGGASTETDPSLSQDSCFLYFASDNGTNDFDLYRAARN
jgi:hypothetical protein